MIIMTLLQTMSMIAPDVPPAPPAPSSPSLARPMPMVMTARVPAAERYIVDIDVRADNTALWTGSLRVASDTGASFRRDQSEADEVDCGSRQMYRPGIRTAFSLDLRPVRLNEGYGGLMVTVRWSRPGAAACSRQSSARTVEMTDSVTLGPGQTATLKGDGGLVVQLRRRP